MNIKNLYASAWDTAIEQTAEFVNKFGFNYTYRDWRVLEPFAICNGLDFDENGYLISDTVTASRKFTRYPQGHVRANMDFSRSYNLGSDFQVYGTEYDQSGEFTEVCSKDASTVEQAAKIVHEWLQDGLDVFVNSDLFNTNEVWFDSRHYMGWDEIQRELESYIDNEE